MKMADSETDTCNENVIQPSPGVPLTPVELNRMWYDQQCLREHQESRLKLLMQTVMGGNPFWQTRFRKSGVDADSICKLEDLRRLPVTRKQHLVDDHNQNQPYGTNLTYPISEYARLHQTSGTTGRPVRWLDTPDSWNWFGECWRQIYLMIGLTPEDRMFFPFSFGPFIGFWAAFDGAARLGNLCIPGGGLSSESRLRMIEENQATVICCTPTYAMRLAEVAAEKGYDISNGSVRALVVAGEPGGSVPSIRKRIETAWGARVFDHWGMTEIGSLAVEHSDRPGDLYVLETECIAEVVDPETMEPTPDGEIGELLMTNLGRLGSPLIRYGTGDRVRVRYASRKTSAQNRSPQLPGLLVLEGGILGRGDDMVTIRGNNVYPSSVEAIVREFTDVAEFQMYVTTDRAMSQLTIHVEPTPDCLDTNKLTGRITQVVRERLNFQPSIQLVESGSLPRFELKGRRFHRGNPESGGKSGR